MVGGRTGREEGQESGGSPEGREAPGGQECCGVSSPGGCEAAGWGLESAAGSGAPRGLRVLAQAEAARSERRRAEAISLLQVPPVRTAAASA